MLAVAFKEWAAVCRAVGTGRQSVILRKGGINEDGGAFRPEYPRFWLYETHFHEQQQAGLKPEAAPLVAAAEADRPPAGTLRFTHFVDVTAVRLFADLPAALALDPFHVWTPATVEQRFHYRRPGLYLLVVRAFALPEPVTVPEYPEYAGCKTWVDLQSPPGGEAAATPVLGDAAFAAEVGRIQATSPPGPLSASERG